MIGWQLFGLLSLIASIIIEDDRLFRLMVIVILFAIYITVAQ